MDMTQCSIGHFYDSDEYASCPFCAACMSEPDIYAESEFDRSSFQQTMERSVQSVASSRQQFTRSARSVFPSSQQQSIFLDPVEEKQKMVVGWLVAVEGACKGKSFELHEDGNTIGRSAQNQICIPNDPHVSRFAAAVGYDARSFAFFCRPDPNSSSITFVNQQPLLQHALLKQGDVITVGKTKLMLVPFCTKEFHW